MELEAKKKIRYALRAIIILELIIIMPIMFCFFIGHRRVVVHGSMNPTLVEGDNVFIERTTMFFSNPKRGDVMTFPAPYDNISNTPFANLRRLTGLNCSDVVAVKRVIGLPGETITIKPDEKGRSTVYINGKKLDEKYIMDDHDRNLSYRVYEGTFVVPKDSYFMLGDNRNHSYDSRSWGSVKKDKFIGKVIFVFYPFNRVKRL